MWNPKKLGNLDRGVQKELMFGAKTQDSPTEWILKQKEILIGEVIFWEVELARSQDTGRKLELARRRSPALRGAPRRSAEPETRTPGQTPLTAHALYG